MSHDKVVLLTLEESLGKTRERERERGGLANRKDVVGRWEIESKTEVW